MTKDTLPRKRRNDRNYKLAVLKTIQKTLVNIDRIRKAFGVQKRVYDSLSKKRKRARREGRIHINVVLCR